MKLFFLAFALIALCGEFVPTNAKAEPLSGEKLLHICKSDENTASGAVDSAFCSGFINGTIAGAVDMETALTVAFDGKYKRLICIPPTPDASRRRDLVINFLEQHPESGREQASTLIIFAVERAFPCR